MIKEEINRAFSLTDNHRDIVIKTSRAVWEFAEEGMKEYKTVAYYISLFRQNNFTIEENAAGLETAFIASWGSGKPVIGLLGEYDALPGLSQESDSVIKEKREGNTWGHGCGHNCLGAAAMGAALAVRDWLQEKNLPGTIRFYGCPGEENGGGKCIMAEKGLFRDLDACFTWHPGDLNMVITGGSLANISSFYEFFGKSAHAAGNPEAGRSALDAAELANIGVNFLREHMISSARVHYGFWDAGSRAPNVVQDYCMLNYYVRAPRAKDAADLNRRLGKIVEGACLMTETSSKVSYPIPIVADYVPNKALTQLMYKVMQELPCITLDKEDNLFFSKLSETLTEDDKKGTRAFLQKAETDVDGSIFFSSLLPYTEGIGMTGSTDVGNVSYVAPTAQCNCAIEPIGTPGHSWQMTSCTGSKAAQKGTLYAAKVLAGSCVSAFMQPELLIQAKMELKNATGGVIPRIE